MADPVAAAGSRHNRHFATDHLLGDLKGRSVRGGVVTLTSQAIKFALQLGSTMVLARLLTPGDFGLIAMVTAITGFVSMFKDAGLSMATVQRKDITHDQVSTLFWINIGLSSAVMLVIAAMAPLIAAFYAEPRLVWITLALAGTMLFGGFTVQHQALLRRQMRFKALAVIEIFTMLAGIATAISMALLGFRYWSLVGMTAGGAMANAVLVWILCDWRPGWPRRSSGVRDMIKFGGNLTGFSFINYWSRNADNALIGYAWGGAALGLYSKAYGLLLLPVRQFNAPITAVFVPAMSRLASDPARFERVALKLLRLLSTLLPPPIVLTATLAPEIILVVLGRDWLGAAEPFRWLALACITQTVLGQSGNLFITQGRTDLLLRLGTMNSLAAITAIVAGLPWGITGVAIAYAVSGLFIRVPILMIYLSQTPCLTLRPVLRAVVPGIVYSLLVFSALVACRSLLFHNLSTLVDVLLAAGIWAFMYLMFFVSKSNREQFSNIKELTSELRREKVS